MGRFFTLPTNKNLIEHKSKKTWKTFYYFDCFSSSPHGLSLFSPQGGCKDEAKANRDKVTETKSSAKEEEHQESSQAPKLSAEQEKQINDLKQKLTGTTDKKVLYGQIAQVFAKANRFDSAAVYAEKIAIVEPTAENWMQAGDMYYQAYTLSLRQENIALYTEKLGRVTKKY